MGRFHPGRTAAPGLRIAAMFMGLALASGASAGESCVPAPTGAIAWYPGDRHVDDLARFHNGTRAGGTGFIAGQVHEGLHFDGIDDFVATDVTVAEQRAVRNAFSYELWAKPQRALPACAQSNNSNCAGLPWAIFPFHGDSGAPPGEGGISAGTGIAIGTNGVCVGEHAPFLVDCLARLDTALANWTHIVVVVENRTPRIYLNGALAHTGVASAKQFVFASWQILGAGLGLGHYQGDLDEITIYDRALTAQEIAALAGASAGGKCRPACAQRHDDFWEAAQVTASSGLSSSNADGMFGAQNASPEPESTLFLDGQPDGTVHTIEWQASGPGLLSGLGLFALHEPIGDERRAFRHFRLQAREVGGSFVTVYDQPIEVPYLPGGRTLDRCINLRTTSAQQFRAEFTQHGPAGLSGPRVVELDGVALPDGLFADSFESTP